MHPCWAIRRVVKANTTIDQAASLCTKLCSKKKAYICLLDIAKAYRSTPHPSISIALNAMGTPCRLICLIELINTTPTATKNFNKNWGSEKSAPSPPPCLPVFKALHATLTREFPPDFALYASDVAIIASDKKTLLQFLHKVSQLSHSLGFWANSNKTQIYSWAPKHNYGTVR